MLDFNLTSSQFQIEDATQENISEVYLETMSVLQETGYSQVLTCFNKGQAVQALKGHFLLYRGMASINQFMEGRYLYPCKTIVFQGILESACLSDCVCLSMCVWDTQNTALLVVLCHKLLLRFYGVYVFTSHGLISSVTVKFYP